MTEGRATYAAAGVDIEAGHAAGLAVWVLATGSDTLDTLTTARPERLLRDLWELAELLC